MLRAFRVFEMGPLASLLWVPEGPLLGHPLPLEREATSAHSSLQGGILLPVTRACSLLSCTRTLVSPLGTSRPPGAIL